MAAKDLINLSRAVQDMGYYVLGTADATIQTLITAFSDAIEKYCRRRFVSTSFDELYNGTGDRRLLLRAYPIQSVQSVRYRPVTVLKITNTDPTNVQARVVVLSTGLQLVRVQNGVPTTLTAGLHFSTNATLSALAASVNTNSGWLAQVVGDSINYGSWPAADLYVPGSYGDALEGSGILQSQGAQACVAGSFAELKMHTYELQGYQWDARGWLLRAIPYTDPELLQPEDLVWPTGINNFRIQYTAGYSTVPEAVQEACARWVALAYNLTLRDPALQSQSISGASHVIWARDVVDHEPPLEIRALLAPYRRHTLATAQG